MAEKKLMVVIGAKASEFNRAMADVQKQTKDISKAFQNVGRDMQTVGKTMTATITAPIVGIATAAVHTVAGFDDSMSNVQAISGATGEEIAKLRDLAKDLGAGTRYAASEAADAMGYLALAGWDTNQILAATPDMLNLAAAAGMDLARAADIVTDTMSAFQMEANQAERAADVFAATSSKSNTNVEQLGEAMKYAAPVANSFGASLETTAALAGRMADAGIKGSQAGTTLRSGLLRLAAPTKAVNEGLDNLGVSVTDVDGNMRDIIDIMRDMEKGMEGMTEQQKISNLEAIFGKNAVAGWMAVIDGGIDTLVDLEGELINSSDAAKDMAETMEDNIGGAFRALKSQTEGILIQLGEQLTPIIKDQIVPAIMEFGRKISDLIDWYTNLDPKTQNLILGAIGVAAAIGPVLFVIGKVVSTIGVLIPIIGKVIAIGKAVGAVIAGVASGPMLLIIGAIAAAIAIGVLLYKNWDTIKEYAIMIWEAISEFFVGLWESTKALFVETWEAITENLTFVWENIKDTAIMVWEFISEGIIGTVQSMWDWMVEAWEAITEYLSTAWEFIKEVATIVWEWVRDHIIETVQTMWDWLVEAWETITAWLEETWETIKATIEEAWNWIRDYIIEIIQVIWDWMVEAWEAITEWFIETWETIKELTMEAWELIKEYIITPIQEMWDWLVETWDIIMEFLGTTWSTIQEMASTTWDTIKMNITEPIQAAWDWLVDAWGKISKFLADTWGGIKKTASDMWEGIYSAIKGIVNKIVDALNKMISGLNSISFDVPEWVPGIGGKSFGFRLPSIPQLATGGDILRAGAAIVGERGPELLHLPQGAQVQPLGGAGGAQQIKHSGTIRVEGINDSGQLTGVVDIIIEKLLAEVRA